MPTPISTILLAEVKKFYPVTDSLSQDKIDTVMNHVKNVIFLQMFGFDISNKIFTGDIVDSAATTFMGFRNFVALNIAAYFAGEVFTHTNAGLKAINQPNWATATKTDKSTTVMPLSDAVTAQFIEAQKVLQTLGDEPVNTFAPYSSFEIHRI
jgi:hypothetical protein